MVFKNSLAPPSGSGLPHTQHEHQSGKPLPRVPRREPFSQPSAQNASNKNSWDQKQPGFPGNITSLGIRQKRQQTSGRYQRNQTGSLCSMLPKRKKQRQERHQQHPASDPE